MIHKTKTDILFDSVNVILLIIIGIAMVFPFLYIFSISFSTRSDFIRKAIILWPEHWDHSAYTYILTSKPFIRSLLFTCYLTLIGTTVNLFFSATMAFGLTYRFVGRKAILLVVIFSLLFSPGLIPTYLIVKQLGMMNSIWSLLLPVAINPFNLIVIRQFFLNVPIELKEAATIDGAHTLHIFLRIMLPLSKPVLAAFGLFYAVAHWNSYFSAILYINDSYKWPIQVFLRQIVIVDRPEMALKSGQALLANSPPAESIQMAAVLMATLPILLIYPLLQKHFAKGVMLGSVKG